MTLKRIGLTLLVALMLVLTACERSASTPPPATSVSGTTVAQPLTPNATQNPMAILQQYATQTAIAAGGASLPTPTPIVAGQTPGATTGTQPPLITPIVTFTPVPGAVLPTATTGVASPPPNVVVPTSTPGKPATYTLQLGEYPYCIARRFNVNPEELLAVNGLTNSSVVQVGTVLKIPTTGSTFPGNAALIPHPANYTVKSGDTVYSVACDYGNADPNQIIYANSLQSPNYPLTTGSVIYIP
jgi:LysM repeat protein